MRKKKDKKEVKKAYYMSSLLKEGLKNQYREEARKNITEFLSKEKASAEEIRIQAELMGIKDLNLHFTEIVIEEFAKIIVGAH